MVVKQAIRKRVAKKKVTKKKVTKKPRVTRGSGKQRVLVDKDASVAVVDISKAKSKFLEIYSNPMDLRDDQEVAKALGVQPAKLAEWRNAPSFFEVGERKFNQNFRGSLVTIKKTLLTQALVHKSSSAMRTVLEMLGQIEGKAGTVNILNMNGQVQDNGLNKLTDEELDDEITLRLSATASADVRLHQGKVVPAEVIDVEYEELDCLNHSIG